MRLLASCAIFSTIFTVIVGGLLLRTGSSAAFALMYPALRLTDKLLGSSIASSDSGLANFVDLVLVSLLVNVVVYTLLSFLCFKVIAFRRTEAGGK